MTAENKAWSMDKKFKVTITLLAALISTSFGIGYKLAGFAFESDARIDVLENQVSTIKVDLSLETTDRKKDITQLKEEISKIQPYIIDTNSRLARIEEGIEWLKLKYRETDK